MAATPGRLNRHFSILSNKSKPASMNRAENLHRLATEEFDLCIIGGGASGAGCALDAVLRGLRVALIEKTDFAAETSSRSTKLIHGGVRYLEQAFKKLDFAQLRQVRHGLEERRVLLQNAPHLTRPLGLITPVFSWWEGFYYSIGLKLYDWVAGMGCKRSFETNKKRLLPPSRWICRQEALQIMPGLSPRIHSAVLYYDGQLDDARYCLALVKSAAEFPLGVLANHLELTGFKKDGNGKLTTAVVVDTLNPGIPLEVKAARFINCTGPFADSIRQMANPALTPRIRPSKGVHLVLPANTLSSNMAMLIPKTSDGRMVFALPFEGNLLLGTTDEPYHEIEQEPKLEADEIVFLLKTLQPFISQKINPEQVKAGFGGIRPLLGSSHMPAGKASKKQTKSLLRDHEVEEDPDSGLISLLGGKWTTYRLMAQDTIDFAIKNTSDFRELATVVAATENYGLAGSENYVPDFWKKLQQTYKLDEDICQHLASKYGTQAIFPAEIALENPELSERILPDYPFLKAEIVYAVRVEMALSIRDFLARRIRLEIMDWEAAKRATPIVAKWMGITLNWSVTAREENQKAYTDLLDTFIQRAKHP
jgi:glycerol-3-phosphate dehydrogenase